MANKKMRNRKLHQLNIHNTHTCADAAAVRAVHEHVQPNANKTCKNHVHVIKIIN